MNQKTAKRLRKIATGMAVIAEEKGQKVDRCVYLQNRKTGQITVSEKSWKGVYKSLKGVV